MSTGAYAKFKFPRESQIFQYLSKDAGGDQSDANINANGDYSVTPEKFFIKPPNDETWVILRMIISAQATGVFRAGGYGALTGGLTNGIDVYRNVTGDISDHLVTKAPVKTNAQWGFNCYDVDVKTWGPGDEFLLSRWTFEKSGRSMALDGAIGEEMGVIVRDDLSGLVNHIFQVQGFKIQNSGA